MPEKVVDVMCATQDMKNLLFPTTLQFDFSTWMDPRSSHTELYASRPMAWTVPTKHTRGRADCWPITQRLAAVEWDVGDRTTVLQPMSRVQ
jgi:hypothetical protein